MKGALEHFHFLSGTYDDTVRKLDIGGVGYLRHSFIPSFPTERVPKTPSVASARSPARALWCWTKNIEKSPLPFNAVFGYRWQRHTNDKKRPAALLSCF